MLIEDQNPFNKSIMMCLMGKPNVGKSSLINNLLGFDLSAVTHKPQTTRNQFHCVFTIDHTEVVLIDTPGLHRPQVEMNRRMNGQIEEAMEGVDLNLLLIDLTKDLIAETKDFKELLERELTQTWIVFTKSDLVKVEELNLEEKFNQIKEIIPTVEKYFAISSTTDEGINILTGAICDHAQEGRHLYPGGQVSNKSERFFVTEYIREQAFELLKEEIPYEIAVVIDEFKDFRNLRQKEEEGRSKLHALISATILVNRPSQRGIVVGKGGSIIKEIGTRARHKIEAMVGGQVRLNLHVKVSPKWFKNNFVLEEIGLPRVENSTRVWRNKS